MELLQIVVSVLICINSDQEFEDLNVLYSNLINKLSFSTSPTLGYGFLIPSIQYYEREISSRSTLVTIKLLSIHNNYQYDKRYKVFIEVLKWLIQNCNYQ